MFIYFILLFFLLFYFFLLLKVTISFQKSHLIRKVYSVGLIHNVHESIDGSQKKNQYSFSVNPLSYKHFQTCKIPEIFFRSDTDLCLIQKYALPEVNKAYV